MAKKTPKIPKAPKKLNITDGHEGLASADEGRLSSGYRLVARGTNPGDETRNINSPASDDKHKSGSEKRRGK